MTASVVDVPIVYAAGVLGIVLFDDMREERTADEQRQYFTYFISDHRPVWARFALKPAP